MMEGMKNKSNQDRVQLLVMHPVRRFKDMPHINKP